MKKKKIQRINCFHFMNGYFIDTTKEIDSRSKKLKNKIYIYE